MKIIKLLLIILCTLTFSCNRYDDSPIWSELQDLKDRVARLEKLCYELNSNISALEGIVEALQQNDYVTGIYPLTEEGVDLGYKITFSKSGDINIYHGKAGAAGAPGQDGADGADGKDGHTPQIGVRKDTDGVYYWTLDGEWLTDSEGNKIPTTGKDGADGEPGEDGKPGAPGHDGEDGEDGEAGKPGKDGEDGITPLLKIEDDYWYISYDNGQSWQQLYKAVGEDGAAGANGTDGAPGKDGQSFFQSVDTTNPNYIILTLADGSQIKIPTWKAFEELQTKVNQMNTNLAALQTILEAIQNSDYVTEITTATENGKEVGYTIHFSKSQPVTIYHGKDGANGAPGQDGEDGKDGADGKDGHTPVIGIRKATDEDWSLDSGWLGDPVTGYYWTIDGEWLLDSDGNKIPATGHNVITPLLKIEDGIWYVSTDEGKTWKAKGPATGSNIESIFTNISYTSEYLHLTLATGETISLSRHHEKASIVCSIEPTEITAKTVTFNGHIDIETEDITYSQVTIYYSEYEDINIFSSNCETASAFDYNHNFSITLNGLKPSTKYFYCVGVKVREFETYGPVRVFYTISNSQGKNLVNPNDPDWTQGRLSPVSGILSNQDADKWYTTGYIPVTAGTYYVASGTYINGNRMTITGSGGTRWYFFDSEKAYLGQNYGYFFNDGASYRPAPEGADYVRVSFQTTYSLPQIEIGIVATAYEEYSMPNLIDLNQMSQTLRYSPAQNSIVKNTNTAFGLLTIVLEPNSTYTLKVKGGVTGALYNLPPELGMTGETLITWSGTSRSDGTEYTFETGPSDYWLALNVATNEKADGATVLTPTDAWKNATLHKHP